MYTVQWDDVIGTDTILTSTWTIPAPLVQGADSISGTETTVYIGGGVAGSFYEIINEITTSGADTFDQSFTILCAPVTDTSGVSIFSVTRNDIILAAVLTMAYACVAFINLGSCKAPETWWQPASRGEWVIADFGSVQDIARISASPNNKVMQAGELRKFPYYKPTLKVLTSVRTDNVFCQGKLFLISHRWFLKYF